MMLMGKIGRWLWANDSAPSSQARDRRLPIWEYQWFNRVYRIAMLLGWCGVVVFFLLWNLVWASP